MAIDYLEETVVDLFDVWAKRTPHATAVEWKGQKLTFTGLRDASLHVSKALLEVGVGPGHMIPILSQMSLEILPAILGVLRVGACYVPIDMAAWSKQRIESTLEDISPNVAIATRKPDTSRVPVVVSFQQQWLNLPFDEADMTCSRLDAIRRRLDSKALVYVTFTSGTTGKPKGCMIYHRALCQWSSLTTGDSFNTFPGDRVLLAFSISFDACAAVIWSTITRGGALIMAEWSTFPEVATTCDTLILTPSMLASLDPKGPYDKVHNLYLGAEAPNFDIARQWVTPTRKVVHTYGPSEATIVISYGRVPEDSEPDLGTINPGVEVTLVDENLQESDVGEILIGGPCLAAGYLNNPELTAKKFIDWNGKRVYRTNDLARRTEKGLSWIGRADRMVKNRGFLVNLETEVETAMLRFEEVRASSAFMWRGKLVGFVQPAAVNIEEMRVFMKQRFDPFVVPDEILAMDQFPLTAHGKVDRATLHAQLEERMAQEDAELDAMTCTSPYDALRWAFAKCLQVPFKDLHETSSFSQLGGNSLAAIRLPNFLRQQDYFITIPEVLREDTIDNLARKLTKISEQNGSSILNGVVPASSGVVHATDLHKIMLDQTRRNPLINALMVRGKFAGPQDLVPTPSELQAAWTATLAAHSVFKTRYDMHDWTIHDLDHVNLDWKEVGVEAEDFDHNLFNIQEQVWANYTTVQHPRLEEPFCEITCVSTPDRKTIGWVWLIHHSLIDPFSLTILIRDLEQALTKQELNSGPSIRDYSRFMHKYKEEKLNAATEYWKRMLKPLSSRTLFDFKPPQTPFTDIGNAWRLLHFTTKETVGSIETSVQTLNVSSATLIFAAWALVLTKYTRTTFASFIISRSGRMVSWPQAPSLVAAMNCRVPFGTTPNPDSTITEWLTEMHNALLGVAELENLCQSLPSSICPEDHFKTGVQAFLYMPEAPSTWEIGDKLTGQPEPVGMVWKVQQGDNGGVAVEMEIDQKVVHVDWAQEVGEVAVQMLEGLTHTPGETKLRDLTFI